MTRPEAALIDELEFRSYAHNRKMFPAVAPARWDSIFSNVPEMEERYLDMLSTGNILDVAPRYWCPTSGNEYQHPGKCPECGDTLEIVLDVADRATGNAPVTDGLQVGDEGVSGTVDGHGYNQGGNRGISAQSGPSENQASPADFQYQGLTIEWLTGAVISAEEHAEQLRLEEEAAAEEGAAIENSGYRDPAENVRFA